MIEFQLVSAFALSESIQAEPRCSQLGKYALRPDLKNQLALDVIVYEPKKDVSVSLVSFHDFYEFFCIYSTNRYTSIAIASRTTRLEKKYCSLLTLSITAWLSAKWGDWKEQALFSRLFRSTFVLWKGWQGWYWRIHIKRWTVRLILEFSHSTLNGISYLFKLVQQEIFFCCKNVGMENKKDPISPRGMPLDNGHSIFLVWE